MNKKIKLSARTFTLLIWVIAALTVVGIALRTVNLFFFFDYDINYYSAGAALPVVSNILFALTALFIAVVCVGASELPFNADGKERGTSIKITSALCAVAFVVAAGVIFSNSLISVLITIAMAVSAIYFILNISRKATEAQALTSVALIISLAYAIATSYFDVFTQMNSPIKIHLHLAILCSMIFITAEARCIIGMMKKRFYFFSLATAVLFTGVSSIPSLIAILAGKLEYRAYDFYYVYDLLTFALFVYFAVRLITLAISVNKSSLDNAATEEVTADEAQNEDIEESENTDCSDEQ